MRVTVPRRFRFSTRIALLAASLIFIAHLSAQQAFTPEEMAGIQKDTSRHFGDAPENPGPKATDLSTAMDPGAVKAAMRKVADWELVRSQPYFDRIWTWSVLYSGFMATSASLNDARYRDAMQAMGEKFNWQLRSEHPNADDQSVGQTYLELYLKKRKPEMKAPTQAALDALMGGEAAPIPKNQAQIPWWWCDALFMAPPIWSRMYAATNDAKYLAYLDMHWWESSKLLYDPQRHLYFRDATFLHATDSHGNPVFWSRGNGWVMAGIARTLDYLPANYPTRGRYETQLREMAAAVAALQDPQSGLWHASMLNSADFPLPETSGSALMTFALAWGVNHGVLERAVYEPVIAKAWRGLIGQIYADGRIGGIQQTGAAPAHYLPSSSYNYGVGAFLLAGSEVARLAPAVSAKRWKLECTSGSTLSGESRGLAGSRYGSGAGAQDFGFDLTASPQVSDGGCTSDAPFFVSVAEPESNYRVTVELGNGDAAAQTAVKAEARRWMIELVSTRAGQKVKRSFIVNVRTPYIKANESVRLKPREIGSLDWDDKLTIELTGRHPGVRSIEIEAVNVPTVYLAGDSTVVDQDKEPWAAWGQMLPAFFEDRIAIANHAESGETIRSFESEHRFAKIISTIRPGDYLFMQFAHNDQKPGSGFVPIPQYQDLLRRYIGLARGKGAYPVLVTSMNRRSFAADGTIEQTLGGYPDAMREVAREERVPLIDLNAMSKTLFEAMGPDGTLKAFVHYPANTFPDQPEELKDDTHFNSYGALELAKCVVESIRSLNLPIARDIRRDVPRFDPGRPDSPGIWSLPPDPFLSATKPYER